MAEDASTEDKTVAILSDAVRESLDIKQALNNLVDMVNDSSNSAGAQDLNTAMRSWGVVYRSLALQREKASNRRDKHLGYLPGGQGLGSRADPGSENCCGGDGPRYEAHQRRRESLRLLRKVRCGVPRKEHLYW